LAGIGLTATAIIAERRWRRTSAHLVLGLDGAFDDPINESDLRGLPPPVAAYFRRVLPKDAPAITSIRFDQIGEMLMNERWRDFSASERLFARPVAFVWDARVRMAPLLYTLVRDAYMDGVGSLRASFAGMLTVADMRGGEALNSGALYRYLAEATWMPMALLPRYGVTWTAVDEWRAVATLQDFGTSVSLEFTFNRTAEVTRIFAAARYRALSGYFEPTPWEGRFGNYAQRCGMWIPLEAEVSWQLAGRWQPCWRGQLVDVAPVRHDGKSGK
jgi:hypothetical protein